MEELIPYKEYTRSREYNKGGPDEWDSLKESIETEGIKDPLVLFFGRNGVAKIGEGNHRLAVAQELGIDFLPVRFGGFWQSVELNSNEELPTPSTPDRVTLKEELPAKEVHSDQSESLDETYDAILDLLGG